VAAVAVAGHDEQVGSNGCGGDFPLDAPVPFSPLTRPGQPAGGVVEQFRGGRGRERGNARSRVAFWVAAAQQARISAMRRSRDLVGGDVEQDDSCLGRD
jgi:hypothetical protein